MSAQDGLVAVVIGGGTMGGGIAEVLLSTAAAVEVVEPDAATATRLADRLGDRRGLTIRHALPSAVAADLVVEAVPEDLGVKQQVLAAVEGAVPESCVLATNTSALSINAIAARLRHPGRFIGMHFFNPVTKSLLIELVVGDATSDRTLAVARDWVRHLGKEEIVVSDSPGFATSRLGVAVGLEAIRMVEEGVATPHDIDRGMELGYRFPMGPLRLTDLVGLDVRLAIADHLAKELGPRFEPPRLLRRKVAAGEIGKKAGKGFFEWS